MEDLPALYTVKESAKVLRLHINSVYALIHKGDLTARKFGRKILITESNLKKFIEGGEG